MLPEINIEINWTPGQALEAYLQMEQISKAFNELTRISNNLPEEERKAVQKFIGSLMASVLTELKMPLENKFPELNKDK